MRTPKFFSCTFILLIAFSRICQCLFQAKIRRGGVFDEFLSEQEETGLIINTVSFLECANECLKRKTCKFFRAKIRMLHVRFKCNLDFNDDTYKTYQIKTCKSGQTETDLSDYIRSYPSRLAGVCSDHTCDKRRVCTPSGHGTYKCDLNKKDKQRLRKQLREEQREKRKQARENARRLAAHGRNLANSHSSP